MNFNKLFDIENGLGIEDGIKLVSGDASPLSLTPPENTYYLQPRGVLWLYRGGSWHLVDYKNFIDSEVITYSGDNFSSVRFEKSGIRVFQIDLTYVNGIVTKEELSLFDTNGITLLRKVTNTYSYSGDNLSSVTRTEA